MSAKCNQCRSDSKTGKGTLRFVVNAKNAIISSNEIKLPAMLTHSHPESSNLTFESLLIPRSGMFSVFHTFHLPLLRARASLAMRLAHNVDDKADLLPMSITKTASLSCVEWSLRCLAMSAMIDCGMFKRNGDAALNMNFNYVRPPITFRLRDLDMRTVCILSLIFTIFLFFFLLFSLSSPTHSNTSHNTDTTRSNETWSKSCCRTHLQALWNVETCEILCTNKISLTNERRGR